MGKINSQLLGRGRGVLGVTENIPSRSALADEFRKIVWSVLFECIGDGNKDTDGETSVCEKCNRQGTDRVRWTAQTLCPIDEEQELVVVNLMQKKRRIGVRRATEKIHKPNQIICREHLEILLEQLTEDCSDIPNKRTRTRKRTRTKRK